MQLLSNNADQRATERFVLRYSLVWIAVMVTVMVTHAFRHWGNVGHMLFGVGLAAPLWVAPFLLESDKPLAERYATRFQLWITLFSLLQVYFGSGLFFDALGMEYHFPVTWIVNRSPLFLYFVTVAYFSTYYVVMGIVWRATGSSWLALPIISFATAFAETAGMANPLVADVFSYRDKAFVLAWGSAIYGSIFVLSLPFVSSLEERRPSLKTLVLEVLAVNMMAIIGYEIFLVFLKR